MIKLSRDFRRATFLVAFLFIPFLFGQASDHPDSNRGLHATLKPDPGYFGDAQLETLTFRLTNDSDKVLDSTTSSWVLVIDGKQAPDPGGQLWMGPQPAGGYGTVRPGTTYQFGEGTRLTRVLSRGPQLQDLLESRRI